MSSSHPVRGLADLRRSWPSLGSLLTQAERAADSEAPILILGEPGTGRSTLARSLHALSRRARGPLVEVDISAIPSTLFESELFGYRAGAFTGADQPLVGRVERAAGGSLLLDHVEEIPVAAQPKLLRLLSEDRYTPLGGDEQRADVRSLGIAADDLPERVARGSFRRDLFHRLEVITLRLPPLRERPADLEPMVELVLADLGDRFGYGRLEISAVAREWMAEYPWPGNLRELRNVLERAVITADAELLDPPCPDHRGGRPESLRDIERRQIVRALAYTRGHQGKAAELLGISRKTLWEKRRRHGIP